MYRRIYSFSYPQSLLRSQAPYPARDGGSGILNCGAIVKFVNASSGIYVAETPFNFRKINFFRRHLPLN